MTPKPKSKCNTCGHKRSSHTPSGNHYSCKDCGDCGHYTCSICGLVDANGRASLESYRTSNIINIEYLSVNTTFAASRKYDEFLMFWYWQKLECGCWIEVDVRKMFKVQNDEWFGFCLSEEGNTVEKRLAKVSELWKASIDQVIEILNIGAVKA